MKYLFTSLLLTLLCFGLVTGSEEKTIELVKSELYYCRYIAYESRHDNINPTDALDWVDGIIEIALEQLEEIHDQQ